MSIKNPIIRGFNPDPSIVRAGDDYYIVTSTFEWLPGVPVYHSKNLRDWELITHILADETMINLQGVDDSAGVWAPSLSYADGQFWLIYTNIHTCGAGVAYKDINIFLTTATDIKGPWTEPVRLNSIGFDPSLFHDDDGRKWLANMVWDFRKDNFSFAGIVIQEYDHVARKLVGPMKKIMQKEILCEGPNLYKYNGYYYLMMAEGGTGWNHGIGFARSKELFGPYELDPQEAVLTTRDNDDYPLQKAGHGELVQTPDGDWAMVHLASRPVVSHGQKYCVTGRETCIEKVVWKDGWLRLEHGGHAPLLEVLFGAQTECKPNVDNEDFESTALGLEWCSLRQFVSSKWLSLTERPGYLRLYGGQSLSSKFTQSLLVKRIKELNIVADTCLDFSPEHFTQMAGLTCYYDTSSFYYLRVTNDEERGVVVGIVLNDAGSYDEIQSSTIEVNDWEKIHLRADINGKDLQFYISEDGATWQSIGPVLDITVLSDDYGAKLRFTGAMVGICAQDLGGIGCHADFDYFNITYK